MKQGWEIPELASYRFDFPASDVADYRGGTLHELHIPMILRETADDLQWGFMEVQF